MEVLERKWDSISLDFVTGLLEARGKINAIWMIVDRLTKSAHFIALANTWTLDQLTRAYLNEVVCFHGVLSSIVFGRETRFQARFLQKL